MPGSEALNPELINPFIDALAYSIDTYVSSEIQKNRFYLKESFEFFGDVTGSIPIAGKCEGYVSISFHNDGAVELARYFLSDDSIQAADDLVLDCIGEIANCIAGLSKEAFANSDYEFSIGLPVACRNGVCPEAYQSFPCLACQFLLKESIFEMELRLNPRQG